MLIFDNFETFLLEGEWFWNFLLPKIMTSSESEFSIFNNWQLTNAHMLLKCISATDGNWLCLI